jgi:hypothetical protein
VVVAEVKAVAVLVEEMADRTVGQSENPAAERVVVMASAASVEIALALIRQVLVAVGIETQ